MWSAAPDGERRSVGEIDEADDLQDPLVSAPGTDVVNAVPAADNPGTDDTNAEIARAREQIEVTRSEMAGTIDAIREKLDPQNLMAEAKETVREATVGRAQRAMNDAMDTARDAMYDAGDAVQRSGSTLMDSIRENPLPAALIGIGLGWLYLNTRKSQETSYRYGRHEDRWTRGSRRPDGSAGYSAASGHYPSGGTGYAAGNYPPDAYASRTGYASPTGYSRTTGYTEKPEEPGISDRLGNMAERAQQRAGDVVDRVQDRAGRMVDQVQDRAGQMVDQLQDRAEDLRDRAGEWADTAQQQARRAADTVQRTMYSNPIAVGAAAVALGAAVGLMIPESQQENEMMGELRDRLAERAQQKAREVGDRVQSVAQEAIGTVQREMQPGGNTP